MVNPATPASGTGALLLVLAPFEDTARRVESHLLSAGHRMRVAWISDLAQLKQQLQSDSPDLLLAAEHVSAAPLKDVIDLCRRFSPRLPVLALAQQFGVERMMRAVATGARDLVSDADADSLVHLRAVCIRELTAYRQLRELEDAITRFADIEARYASLVGDTGDAVAHLYEGILAEINPAFASLLGHTDATVLNGLPLMDLVAPDHHAEMKDRLRKLDGGRGACQSLESSLFDRGGAKLAVQVQLKRGAAGDQRFIEMLIRRQTAAPAAKAPSGRLAFYETLTATPASSLPRACLFVVVDGFASLEERVGFDDAERVIEQATAALRAVLTEGDELFRFSTHEFGLRVSRPDSLEFEALAARLVKDLGQQVFSTSDHDAQLTISTTVYPLGDAETASQVIGEVVREARRISAIRGGNRSQVLGPTARANAEEREEQRKLDNLRKAIEQNRLKLAYQTIASLEGDSRQHFDVLVRMINEQGQEIHATDFIRTAEKHGLMRSIDRWVMGRVLRVIASRESLKEGSMLFVKVSEDTLKDAEGFFTWLHEALGGRRLRDGEICFEIQEKIVQNHIRKARVLTKVLRDSGASIAIEHFGIGANPAQLIEHLPVNFLKFHSSFTHNFDDREVQKKMSMLMEMARQRGIKTIVSHVEDANVMARMWQMGINFIQGYHVQEPEVVMLSDEPRRR
ncbi:MAG: EAL domain-containing protein [Panacagrimonas sp.]